VRWLLAGLLIAHGIAHVVGFVVPWKLLTSKEVPYRTTVLAGSVDLGDMGARLLRLMWLGVAVGLAIAGAGRWYERRGGMAPLWSRWWPL